MPRPVTLFTGQWADLPLAELAPLARSMGYDGVELACWGDHFDVDRGARAARLRRRRSGSCSSSTACVCHAISNHLVGQAVCDHIDERHKAILPRRRLGRRRPRRRAPARRRRDADARPSAAARVRRRRRQRLHRLEHLALDLRLPADEPGLLGRGLRRTSPSAGRRSSTRSTRHDVQLRPRGASDRNRLRHRLGRARARGGRRAPALRLQLRPVAPRLPGRRLREVHPRASPIASSTST